MSMTPSTAAIPTFVAGTTGPAMTFTFVRNGVVVSLAGGQVSAVIHRGNLPALHKNLAIVGDGTPGQAQLQWSAGDLAVSANVDSDDVEIYKVDFHVTTALGEEVQPDPYQIRVRPPTA